jgi:hypothetical protein
MAEGLYDGGDTCAEPLLPDYLPDKTLQWDGK